MRRIHGSERLQTYPGRTGASYRAGAHQQSPALEQQVRAATLTDKSGRLAPIAPEGPRMSLSIRSTLTSWTTLVPVMAMIVLAAAWGREVAGVLVVLVTVLLAGAVLAAVHH